MGSGFLGLEPQYSDPEKARFAILPLPYEKTTTYKKGTARGPEALIEASCQVELFDEVGGKEWSRTGITTCPPLHCEGMPEVLAKEAESVVAGILDRGQVPFSLGGEHSVSLGPIRAVHARYPDLSILHFDAHGDLRDSYEGTAYGHGCIMRRVHDLGIPLVQVGIRSLCQEEKDLIDGSDKIRTFFMPEVRSLGKDLPAQVASHLTDHVYLSFDVDGLDPSVIAATGTPEPGGLGWFTALEVLEHACAEKTVVGADLVELLPISGQHASDFAAARLAYKMIGYIARSRRFPFLD